MPRLVVGDGARDRAAELLAAEGIDEDRPLVALGVGAGRPTKRWPAARFAELGDLIIEQSAAEVLLLGDAKETALAREISQMMAGVPHLLTGRTTAGQLAAVLARCRVLVTNDSGPMHVATAVSTPVVAIFGPTTTGLGYAPLGPQDIVISRSLECRPCSLHGSDRCPTGTFECMEAIEAREVLEHVLALLDRTTGQTALSAAPAGKRSLT
jgi:heptosyltransferase-2